jgi:hypothetical protein
MMSTIFGGMGGEQDDLSLQEDVYRDIPFLHPVVMDDTMPELTTIVDQLNAYYDACSVHGLETKVPFFSFRFLFLPCINQFTSCFL